MAYSISYPQTVRLEDGTQIRMTDSDWKERQLIVEIDRSETDVRDMLAAEGFKQSGWEFVKDGQIGSGMVKRINDWQIHFRLFRHNDRIQIDGEAEVSKMYVEHLTHGWISALAEGMDVLRNHFGTIWLYHKGLGKYVTEIVNESILEIPDPKSKTSTVIVVILSVIGVLIAGYLASKALKK